MEREKLDLTQEDGYKALKAHVVEKAQLARARYGPDFDEAALLRLFEDRDLVRYPTELVVDSGPLQEGEFAIALAVEGDGPRSYRIYVHPHFAQRPEDWPALVGYHLPTVNYADLVTHEEAELFGATMLGMEVEAYYERVCGLADELPGRPA